MKIGGGNEWKAPTPTAIPTSLSKAANLPTECASDHCCRAFSGCLDLSVSFYLPGLAPSVVNKKKELVWLDLTLL